MGKKTGPKPKPWQTRYDINPATGCHEWNGGRSERGYGLIVIDGKQRYAHRVAYARAHGEVPEGLCVCHHCDNPSCVNMEHLFLGTQAENTADMDRKGRRVSSPQVGARHWKARLSSDDVAEIRRAYGAGGVRQVDLARRYGVAQAHVSAIIRGAAWGHIPLNRSTG